jgi:hypothetical protein
MLREIAGRPYCSAQLPVVPEFDDFNLDHGTTLWYQWLVKRKNLKTLESIFAHPVPGNIQWLDILALFRELGAEITERQGSRVGVRLFGERRVFHRPHPLPNTDKGAVASIRKGLEENGVKS